MDKTMAGVLGAITALAVTPLAAQAAPSAQPASTPVAPANSYGDLLNPIPNALDLLAAERTTPAEIQPVQYYDQYGNYYYPHHHNHWQGGYNYHHHHHHHNYGNGYNGYGNRYYGNGYNGYYGYGNGYGGYYGR
jgi:hypothetical protein